MFVSVHEPVIVLPERSSILICWLTDYRPIGGNPRPLTACIQPSSAVSLNIFGLIEGLKSDSTVRLAKVIKSELERKPRRWGGTISMAIYVGPDEHNRR